MYARLLPICLAGTVACLPDVQVDPTPGVRGLAVRDTRQGRTLELTWNRLRAEGLESILIARGSSEIDDPVDAEASFSVAGVETRFVDDTVPLDGSPFIYSVFALYENGTRSPAVHATGTATDQFPPIAAAGLSVGAGSNLDRITVTWALADPDVVEAIVVRRTDRPPEDETDGTRLIPQVVETTFARDSVCENPDGIFVTQPCLDQRAGPFDVHYGVVLVDPAGNRSEFSVVSATLANTGAPFPSSGLRAALIGASNGSPGPVDAGPPIDAGPASVALDGGFGDGGLLEGSDGGVGSLDGGLTVDLDGGSPVLAVEVVWQKISFIYDWERSVLLRVEGDAPDPTNPTDGVEVASFGAVFTEGGERRPPVESRVVDEGVSPGESYAYWVFDVDLAGNFARTGPATITIPP